MVTYCTVWEDVEVKEGRVQVIGEPKIRIGLDSSITINIFYLLLLSH
jgi:hypothetical protein